MNNFKTIFFIFMFYSIIGWIIEVINSFIREKKFVNRGFLIGTYCPIYGFGCTIITLLLGNNSDDFVSLFLKSVLICSVLEYFTSYIMEKIFKYRWWDYSDRKYNINGRVCLETMVPFGLGACIIVNVINPHLFKLFNSFSPILSTVLFIILLLTILLDFIISIILIFNISDIQKNEKIDSTEELKSSMLNIIKSGKTFYKRIFNSFPGLKKSK